nr:bifunctional [glutamate--ammonia ligase]-adenylyl-L-tyrosine phosphorylase/[glutamate--ammonia-ligase] adenylyltransferase [Natronospira proteinivora]
MADKGLEHVLAVSPYIEHAFARDEGLAEWLLTADRLETVQSPEAIAERWAGLREMEQEADLMRALRRARNREMVLCLWRDLQGWASLAETLAALSATADTLISAAHDWAEAKLQARHGIPRNAEGEVQSLVVLALGKLGGQELNFSSDVDLIFVFPEAGETDGERCLDNEPFFVRLGQQMIRLLDETTADGQVYRVDMRLRPFGASGPLVMNFTGVETYYQLHGREWERYALIKARPVAGDIEAGEDLMKTLRPFVYRRYLDYSVFGSLRDMKQGIRREVRRKGLEANIKLGRGGIREIEFIAQLFQLIRGGREPALQSRRLLPVLAAIGEQGHLEKTTVAELSQAYECLRRLENRIQGLHDAQTHDLPRDSDDQARLLKAMDMAEWSELEDRVAAVRQTVAAAFDDVFVGPALPEEQQSGNAFADLWQDRLDEAPADKLLRRTGFEDPARARQLLASLRESHPVRRMGERGRQRLDRLLPSVLHLAAGKDNAVATLQQMLQVVEAIATRTAYLALLVENPRALEHLGRLCSASPWVADRIARHPLLLDELIDPRIFQQAPAPEDYAQELDALLRPAGEDLERLMDGLREFHQAVVLRIVAADINGTLSARQASDRLTLLAELILDRVQSIARADLIRRHGHPRCQDPEPREPGFITVAYGKLGSHELAYGSDLDLVFLHDSAGEEQQTDGERCLDNGQFFARLAQRIIHQLATPTPAGVLYEVDTRLRPSGASGLLVSGLAAFVQYQSEKAWTWEHQALLRARAVAGEAGLRDRFEQARREILARPRDEAGLRDDIVAMRSRMLESHASGEDDPKRDAGGLVDIEFLAQYWALRHAADHPEILARTSTIGLLEALAEAGCIERAQAETLAEAAEQLRAAIHARTLAGDRAIRQAESLAEVRSEVARIWDQTLV